MPLCSSHLVLDFQLNFPISQQPIPQDILDTHSEGGRDEDRGSSEDIYLHLARFPYFKLEDSLRKQKDDEVELAKEIDHETKDIFNTLVRGASQDEWQKAD